ncbi:MAG: hypothetical protein NTY88_06495 [Bacteroidetes bacterium]|nr:hypothetical protein [Bacteroidota bacterium]
MKTNFLLTTIIASALLISSCTKTETKDLTTDIVGTFLGTATDTTAGTVGQNPHTGVTIIVTKVDNTHVQISETTGGYFTSMNATVYESNGVFSITSFIDQGSTWEGVTGYQAYNTSSKQLAFLIHVTAGTGVGDAIGYIGTKQ